MEVVNLKLKLVNQIDPLLVFWYIDIHIIAWRLKNKSFHLFLHLHLLLLSIFLLFLSIIIPFHVFRVCDQHMHLQLVQLLKGSLTLWTHHKVHCSATSSDCRGRRSTPVITSSAIAKLTRCHITVGDTTDSLVAHQIPNFHIQSTVGTFFGLGTAHLLMVENLATGHLQLTETAFLVSQRTIGFLVRLQHTDLTLVSTIAKYRTVQLLHVLLLLALLNSHFA